MTAIPLLNDSHFPLSILPERVCAQASWRMLDIALDSPAVGLEFAKYVSQITIRTPNAEVCQQTHDILSPNGGSNITCQLTDLGSGLPFENSSLDLITICNGPARLEDTHRFLTEAKRVLRADGKLLILEETIPGSHLKGKKARKLREAGKYINAFYKFSRPGQQDLFSQDQWQTALWNTGFKLEILETARRSLDFENWIEPSYLSTADKIRLRVMIIQAPEKVREFLTPQVSGDRIRFRLTEILILATKTADTG